MTAPNIVPLARQGSGNGLCFRVRYNEHTGFARLLAERRLAADALILDARNHKRHEALRREAHAQSIALWFDSQAMELALPGAVSKTHASLAWARNTVHEPEDFTAEVVRTYARQLAEFAIDGGYSTVLAPTHYVAEEGSEWLDIDRALVEALHEALEKRAGASIQIVYPLALHANLLADSSIRADLVRTLRRLPIDRVSLRVHPFGYRSGPAAMRNVIRAALELQTAGHPLLIERAGIAGLAAYAFGAVDGIESGVTFGDTFDVNDRLKPSIQGSQPSSFAPPQQIFLDAFGMTVKRTVAEQLLASSRGKQWFGCRDPLCCAHGVKSMLDDAFRHSALTRQRQHAALARTPPTMRAGVFIDTVVGPAADMLSRASEIDERFRAKHKQMLSVKATLTALHREIEAERRRATFENAVAEPRSAQIFTLPPRDPLGR